MTCHKRMLKRTRKPALKVREFVQSGGGDFWIADEATDHIVQSGTEELWLDEEEQDIDRTCDELYGLHFPVVCRVKGTKGKLRKCDEEAPRKLKRRKLRNAEATATRRATESPSQSADWKLRDAKAVERGNLQLEH